MSEGERSFLFRGQKSRKKSLEDWGEDERGHVRQLGSGFAAAAEEEDHQESSVEREEWWYWLCEVRGKDMGT